MMTNKRVAFLYYDKQRCAVSDIIGLVNQYFFVRDVYIAFFSNSIYVHCRKWSFSFFFNIIHFYFYKYNSFFYIFLNFKGAVMRTLREYIDKNMITNKIVAFHYYDKLRRAVSDIIGLVNQPFLARDVYNLFFF